MSKIDNWEKVGKPFLTLGNYLLACKLTTFWDQSLKLGISNFWL